LINSATTTTLAAFSYLEQVI